MHEAIFKQAELESASGNDRLIYRNFAGGTPEPSDDAAGSGKRKQGRPT